MKALNFKLIIGCAVTGALLSLTNCGDSNAQQGEINKEIKHQFQVPKLMERESMFGSINERDNVLDIYDNAVLAINANSGDLASYLKIAEVFIQEGRITGRYGYNNESALKVLNYIIANEDATEDTKFQGLSLKATVLLSQHKFNDALSVGNQALAINSYNAGIYGVMVDANVELGNYTEAVAMSDKMISIRPDLRSYSRISYLRQIHGENEGAIDAMKMAISAGYPGYERKAWCRVTLGELYEDAGDLTNAQMQYILALEERENYPYALAGLGRLEMKKTNYGEAEKYYTKALSFIEEAGFYSELAKVYQLQGKDDEMVTAKNNAFATLRGVEDSDHGHGHDHDATSGHGHSHEVGLEMAKMYFEFTTDYDEAMSNAMHEYEIRPNNIDVNQIIAAIFYRKGDFDSAKMHLDKAMKTNNNSPKINCLAGLIMIETGSESDGKKLLEKSFSADPYQSHSLAKTALSKL